VSLSEVIVGRDVDRIFEFGPGVIVEKGIFRKEMTSKRSARMRLVWRRVPDPHQVLVKLRMAGLGGEVSGYNLPFSMRIGFRHPEWLHGGDHHVLTRV
jgi:hypothetical protein